MKKINNIVREIQSTNDFEYQQIQSLRIIKYFLGGVLILSGILLFIANEKDLLVFICSSLFFAIIINEEYFKWRIRKRKKKLLILLKQYDTRFLLQILDRWWNKILIDLPKINSKEFKRKLSFYQNCQSILRNF